MVPDYRHVVDTLYARGGWTITTKEGAGHFTEAAAAALHFVDAEFGHLRKPANRTHVVDQWGNRHAVDVVLYKASGQIVDIITDAGEPGARVSWGPGTEHEYSPDDWYAPRDAEIPPPLTPPEDDRLNQILDTLIGIQNALALLAEAVDKQSQRPFPNYRADTTGVIDAGRLFGKWPFSVTQVMKPE